MKILCPIDFSDHSITALKYASRICQETNSSMHIIHVFSVPHVVEDIHRVKTDLMVDYQNEIDTIVKEFPDSIKTNVQSAVKYGHIVEEILDYAENNKIDLVLMASEGTSTIQNRFMGSVAEDVVAKAKVPVLILPSLEEVNFAPTKVLLALDNKELEHSKTFDIPLVLAKNWNTKIDLIHIAEKEDKSFPFDPFIGAFLKDFEGEIHLQEGRDIGFRLMRFVKDQSYQFLIMVKREKGFWARIFNKNHVKEEIQRCFVPLLIVPE